MVHNRCCNTELPQQLPTTRQHHVKKNTMSFLNRAVDYTPSLLSCPLAGRLLLDVPPDAGILCVKAATLSDTTLVHVVAGLFEDLFNFLQGCRKPGREVAVASKLCTVRRNICGRSVGCNTVRFHCNRATANWHYTHALHQLPFVSTSWGWAVMLETCKGPWFSIKWMKSASRWFLHTA
jgi:hypothetical protein